MCIRCLVAWALVRNCEHMLRVNSNVTQRRGTEVGHSESREFYCGLTTQPLSGFIQAGHFASPSEQASDLSDFFGMFSLV